MEIEKEINKRLLDSVDKQFLELFGITPEDNDKLQPLTYDKVIEAYDTLARSAEQQKNLDRNAGRCVCDNCFGDRNIKAFMEKYPGSPFSQRYCLIQEDMLTDV